MSPSGVRPFSSAAPDGLRFSHVVSPFGWISPEQVHHFAQVPLGTRAMRRGSGPRAILFARRRAASLRLVVPLLGERLTRSRALARAPKV
jgi:hypothetical protein